MIFLLGCIAFVATAYIVAVVAVDVAWRLGRRGRGGTL